MTIDYRDVEVLRFNLASPMEDRYGGGPPRAYVKIEHDRRAARSLADYLQSTGAFRHTERTREDVMATYDEYEVQVVSSETRRRAVRQAWDSRKEEGVSLALEVLRKEARLRRSLGYESAAFVLDSAVESIKKASKVPEKLIPSRWDPE